MQLTKTNEIQVWIAWTANKYESIGMKLCAEAQINTGRLHVVMGTKVSIVSLKTHGLGL